MSTEYKSQHLIFPFVRLRNQNFEEKIIKLEKLALP